MYYEIELHDDADPGKGKPRYTTTKVSDGGSREITYTSAYLVDAIEAVPRNHGTTEIKLINCSYGIIHKTELWV